MLAFYQRTFICLYLLAWIAVPNARAQSFYNQGAIVSVLPGTIFSVKDSLVNTGTFVNNGNLLIGGTWLNTGSYDAGAGEITFNSTSPTAPQIINHSNQSFSKLTISGGGRKLILADITIEDEIVFTDGIVEAENDARMIIKASASISGGADNAHVHGPVYHQGIGDKLFPIGNGEVYLPVVLMNVEDPSALIGIRNIDITGMLPGAPSLEAISSERYWHIDVASGLGNNSGIKLAVRDETFRDMNQVVVVESPSLEENFRTIGRALSEGTVNNGTVTSERGVTQPFVTVASSSGEGKLVVYNAVSANQDAFNEFLIIENIENYPENTFSLFNRWGDKIFEIENYDNKERVFRGKSNINGEKDLVNGTYFYVIQASRDNLKINGFLALKN
jgi:gliding motility-associated-like protein